ncbi:capsid protein [Bradyrhizobium sp. SZCCHNS3002]|uniref:major capsid protein n=1 Tax=Bradyrhizobium sp. SZCCHNS3002 TaxID=3057310 RepID=UPI0028F0D930|nr:capsid protein [Bradyrhizobium sp. SZCCHNS3002]
MAQAPFVIQQRLTAITLAYRNQLFIADQVLPRVPVDSSAFKWSKYTLADGFTIPDTRVGRKSAPNEIDWTATEQTDSVVDYALDDKIPNADIQNAMAAQAVQGVMPIDPESRSTELLSDLVALDRENRVATTLFTLGTYPSAQRTTLSGTTQWSDFTNSDPVQAILTALDACLIRPNVAVFGQATWSKLRTHPKVTAAVYPMGGNATGGGAAVSREALADLFELEEVLVGSSWYNSAKPGQTATLSRLWGKHASFIYRAPQVVSPTGTVTFGFTAQWGERISGTIQDDPNIGMRGGTRVRVGESLKEVIAANDAAYFFQNAVA